jgi:hypothetical protein
VDCSQAATRKSAPDAGRAHHIDVFDHGISRAGPNDIQDLVAGIADGRRVSSDMRTDFVEFSRVINRSAVPGKGAITYAYRPRGRALRYCVVKVFIGLSTPSLLPLESIDSTA